MVVTKKMKNVLLSLLLLLPLSLGQPPLAISQTVLSTEQARKIEPQLADQIRPLIQDWLIFYDIDINDFTCEPKTCVVEYGMQQFQPLKSDENSIYNREYSVAEDDIYDPVFFDYSSDKRYYVDLFKSAGVYKNEHGGYQYDGGDDSQAIYLYDRLQKRTDLLIWLGLSEFAHAVYWGKKSSMVVLVGTVSDEKDRFFIRVNNVTFHLLTPIKPRTDKGYFAKRLKEKGVNFDDDWQ